MPMVEAATRTTVGLSEGDTNQGGRVARIIDAATGKYVWIETATGSSGSSAATQWGSLRGSRYNVTQTNSTGFAAATFVQGEFDDGTSLIVNSSEWVFRCDSAGILSCNYLGAKDGAAHLHFLFQKSTDQGATWNVFDSLGNGSGTLNEWESTGGLEDDSFAVLMRVDAGDWIKPMYAATSGAVTLLVYQYSFVLDPG